MPSKNIVKSYVENGYYHIYNRGTEKRDIFLDKDDCAVFLHYIKLYLSPKEELEKQINIGMNFQRFIPLNLSTEIDLLAFALMPNHFHLLIKQSSRDAVIKFMRRLATGYVSYFNKKYERVGGLFQNAYKAVLIDSEPYLLHLSRYIHLNPFKLKTNRATINFNDFSSYPYYLGNQKASWIKPQEILSYFKSSQNTKFKDVFSYQGFVEDYLNDPKETLGELTIEEDF